MLIMSSLAALFVIIRLLSLIILSIALSSRSQSALLRESVNCHKQLIECIRNTSSTTCLVFNKTKMNFLVIEMKGLT